MLYSYPVDLPTKFAILADAAKYDASCASLLRLPADERQRTWPMWIADLAHASNAAAP